MLSLKSELVGLSETEEELLFLLLSPLSLLLLLPHYPSLITYVQMRTSTLRPILRPLLSSSPIPSISPLVTLPRSISPLSPLQLHSRSIGNTPKLGAVKDAISAVLHGSSEAREEAGTQHSRLVGRHVSHSFSLSCYYDETTIREREKENLFAI